MSANTGGPAFPCEQHETQDNMWNQTFQSGMTLRDYFAAKVLPSLVSEVFSWGARVSDGDRATLAAAVAYGFADAMLKARES